MSYPIQKLLDRGGKIIHYGSLTLKYIELVYNK
jgi:hypothetical protein